MKDGLAVGTTQQLVVQCCVVCAELNTHSKEIKMVAFFKFFIGQSRLQTNDLPIFPVEFQLMIIFGIESTVPLPKLITISFVLLVFIFISFFLDHSA